MLTFSQTLDQLGVFARSVPGVAWLAAALAGDPPQTWLPEGLGAPDTPAPLLAAVPTGEWERADAAMRARFEADVAALAAAGARIERLGEGWLQGGEPPGRDGQGGEHKEPAGLDGVLAVHRTIMAAEGAAAIGPVAAAHAASDGSPAVSATLQAILDEGAGIPAETYRAALRERERLIAAFAAWATPFDAILTPPAVGEAPGPETTGDPRFCTRWTLVGAPALVLPTGLGPAGLPLGLQLVGAPGADSRLLAAAAWVESRHPATPFFRMDRP
jgi:Asp-tRNA(Asn)/Glu-tRNA(Gln) amidotransferase A subunit family amidase